MAFAVSVSLPESGRGSAPPFLINQSASSWPIVAAVDAPVDEHVAELVYAALPPPLLLAFRTDAIARADFSRTCRTFSRIVALLGRNSSRASHSVPMLSR